MLIFNVKNKKDLLLRFFFIGAEGGGRTHMRLPSQDFESCASAIPPLRHVLDKINDSTIFNDLQVFISKILYNISIKRKILRRSGVQNPCVSGFIRLAIGNLIPKAHKSASFVNQ